MNPINFECENNFLYRIPRNSISFSDKLSSLTPEKILSDNYIREALYLSSKSLYTNLGKKSVANNHSSITRYLLRSASRTAPNNLWSGVGTGCFSTSAQNVLDEKNFYAQIIADSSWVNECINFFEKELKENLKITLNNTVTISKNFITNQWIAGFYSNNPKNKLEIQNTELITLILSLLKDNYLTISQLWDTIHTKKDVTHSSFLQIINYLLENEFIVSDLRSSLANRNQLSILINLLSNYLPLDNILLTNLRKIATSFDELALLPLGELESKLISIETNMDYFANTLPLFSTDLFNRSTISLPSSVKEDISDLCNFLSHFSYSSSIYVSIYNFLLDEYNETYVPLSKIFEKVEAELLYQDSSTSSDEVTEYLLNSIISENSPQNLNLSEIKFHDNPSCHFRPFELSLNIYKNKCNEYIYAISPMLGSNKMGQNIQKYTYELGDGLPQPPLIDTSDCCEVEIIFFPKEHSISNIMLINPSTKYVLKYGIPNNIKSTLHDIEYITLDDIYVYAKDNQLLFFSKKIKKRLEFVINHKVSEHKMPLILRFLLNCTDNYYSSMFALINKIEHLSFGVPSFPRIMYKNFIIHPHTWNMNSIFPSKCCFKDFVTIFYRFKQKYNIPSTIFVMNMDNEQYIRIETTNLQHLDILFQELNRGMHIQLIEDISEIYTPYVQNKLGESYFCDFIFYLTPQGYEPQNYMCDINKFWTQTCDESSVILPLDNNWLYIKFYAQPSHLEYILTNYIWLFCNNLLHENVIMTFFYIRYYDSDGAHIRLRLKYNNKLLNKLMDSLSQMQGKLLNENLISKVCFDTYKREIIRYGGIFSMPYIENVFYEDSILVLKLLSSKKIKKQFSKLQLAIISIGFILNDLCLTNQEKLIVLSDFLSTTNYTPEYRAIRKKLLLYLNPSSWSKLLQNEVEREMYALLERRSTSIIKYKLYLTNMNLSTEAGSVKNFVSLEINGSFLVRIMI